MQQTKDQAAVYAQTYGHLLSTWRHETAVPLLANWSAQCTQPSCHVWVRIQDRDGDSSDSGLGKPCPYPVTEADEAHYIEQGIMTLLDDIFAKVPA